MMKQAQMMFEALKNFIDGLRQRWPRALCGRREPTSPVNAYQLGVPSLTVGVQSGYTGFHSQVKMA